MGCRGPGCRLVSHGRVTILECHVQSVPGLGVPACFSWAGCVSGVSRLSPCRGVWVLACFSWEGCVSGRCVSVRARGFECQRVSLGQVASLSCRVSVRAGGWVRACVPSAVASLAAVSRPGQEMSCHRCRLCPRPCRHEPTSSSANPAQSCVSRGQDMAVRRPRWLLPDSLPLGGSPFKSLACWLPASSTTTAGGAPCWASASPAAC